MDKLPPEVILQIASYFGFSEKLKLSLLSKQLYRLLSVSILYNQVIVKPDIFKSDKNLADANKFFEKNQHFKQKVTSFNVSVKFRAVRSILNIPDTFPNLVNFEWTACSTNSDLNEQETLYQELDDAEFSERWTQLKTIKEISTIPIAEHLLSKHLCPNLTRINLNYWSENISSACISNFLQNAPMLDYLKLSYPMISLDDMEAIHENTPHLKTLVLHNISTTEGDLDTQLIGSTQFDKSEGIPIRTDRLKPAANLVRLEIIDMNVSCESLYAEHSQIEMQPYWLLYIAEKYPNLKSLDIIDDQMIQEYHDSRYKGTLRAIITNCINLEKCNINFLCYSHTMVEAMCKTGIQLEQALVVHYHSSNKEEKTLIQLSNLANSTQSKSIKALTVKKMRSRETSRLQFFSIMSEFTNLCFLELCHFQKMKPLNLNRLLDCVPSLESLKLYKFILKLDPSLERGKITNIKSLAMTRCLLRDEFASIEYYSDVDYYGGANGTGSGSSSEEEKNAFPNVLQYVEYACPRLTHFTLQKIQSTNRVLKIHFPHHHFSSLEIDILNCHYYKVEYKGFLDREWYIVDQSEDDKVEVNLSAEPDEKLWWQQMILGSILYQGLLSNMKLGGVEVAKNNDYFFKKKVVTTM